MTTPSPLPGRLAALFLLGQFALIQTTLVVLGGAIDWPSSLGDPAAIALPRLVAHEGEVLLGYGCYMVAALLLVPATAALNARLNLTGALAGLTLAFAALSAMAKAIGIGRWLFVMPDLAHAWQAPGAERAALGPIFEAFNAYAGGIGEVLGVGLLGGVWTLIVAWALFRTPGVLPRLLGALLACGGLALLASVSTHFGVDLGPSMLMFSNVTWQVGLLALGVWAAFRPRKA